MHNEDSSYQSQSDSESQSANLNHLAPQISQSPKPKSPQLPKQDPPILISQVINAILPNPSTNRLMIPSQNRPRLIIDKIVLENFKSYADTQAIGPFHENFTSVVGPNGSGKSNLIESMLFIFGYKANWMRLNRLNQLIHNSSTMGSVERASVEVRFKKIIESEDGKITQLNGAGFSIRRTVKMSGQSKYYINRDASTQAQVKNRLKQQGIDLNNNRFLILQGQVQQISQMKQKSGDREKPGLLQYLEDIIGSSVYIEQIQASVSEYNAIEQTKHEKGQLMKLAEVQLKSMTKGKEQAIRFVKKQRQIYQIQNILQQVIISNNKYDSKEYVQKLHKAEADRQRIMNEQRQKLRKQGQRIRQIKKNRLQIENIERQLSKQNETMAKLTSADKNINQQISFKSEDLVKYNRKNNQLDAELSKIISQSEEVKEALPVSKEKLANLKVQLDQMEAELQKHDKPELKQKLKNLETSQKKLQYQIKSFEEKYKSTKKAFDQKFKRAENNQLKQLQFKRDLDKQLQIQQRITEAEAEAKKVRQTILKQLQELSSKKKQLLGQLDKVSFNFREQQDQKRQMTKFEEMFQKIMQQNIPGVLGRLGDLGTVSKQYDEIITSCSMGRLDNIVVKHEEAAHAVLNFLKTTKLGRVTCIILNRIEQLTRNIDKPWSNLPNSIRLFDVIQPVSQEVRRAFYFALSDTIYCENSQLGLEYSMKDDRNRRRVVSKKQGSGYIICQLNGLMNGCLARSGGFRAKAVSKMRNQNQLIQIKQLEKLKETLTKRLSDLQEKQKNTKADFENVNKDLQSFKRQLVKVQLKITEIKQQLGEMDNNAKKNNKNLQQQKQKKQKQLDSLQTQIRLFEKSKLQIQQQISQIQKQQRSQQTEKITRLRDSYKISKQQHQLLDKDIQKKVAILQTSFKRINQNKKGKQEVAKKIQMLNKQIVKLTKERDDIQIKATQILGRTKAGQQRIQTCRKQQQKLKVLYEQEQKQVRQSKLKIQKAKQDVQMCKQKIKMYLDAISNAQQQLKKQRQTYKQLSATYDFMEDLEAIEYMSIQDVKRNAQIHNKSDTSVLLNQSIDISNTSMTKAFPLEKLLEVSPYEDLSEDKLDPFLLFTQKMRTMVIAQTQNLKKMSGSNLQIINQYRKKFTDFKKKHEEFQAVRQSQLQLKKKIQYLKEKRLQLFREGFGIINSKLKQVYQFLTRGGDAELQLIDSLDPFSDGINFSVRPPKKAWKQINKLSGGQKTLSSLSLIFALHYYKPTPLYFMDQIDAALDFKNVSIVADYIKKRTKDAQFIIISLRNNMFELADKLVGVYKTYDKTKIVHFVPSKMRKNPASLGEKQNLDSNQN